MKPYVERAYVGQFGAKTDFHTDNYRFAGQNLNEGNAGLGMGMGMGMKFSEKWSANTRTNTEFGHDVDNEVNAYIGIKYQF